MITIRTLFDSYAAATEKTWAHDRTSTEGASGIFTCRRKRWFAQNGIAADDDYVDRYGAKRRGDLIESGWVVPALRAGLPPGCELLWAGDDQRTLVDGYISATPDGLLVNRGNADVTIEGVTLAPGECVAVEIKSIDPRVDLREAKSEHIGQVHVQMGLIRQCTAYRPDWAIVIYVDASFLDDVTVFPIRYDATVFEAARQRATSIMMAERAEDMPPEGKIAGGKACQYCGWRRQCVGASVGAVPSEDAALDPEVAEALRQLVEQRAAARADEAAAAARVGEIEQEIKDTLRGNGTRRAAGDGWSISWASVKGRKSLDRKAVEAAGIDLAPYEREGEPSERLTIKAA